MDQVERQVIEIDNSQAKAAQNDVTKGWEKVERAADKAAKNVGKTVDQSAQDMLRVVNTSQRATNALISRIESRAAQASRSPAERLAAEREITLKRVGADPKAIDRVNAAYDKLLATQRKLDFESSLAKAQAASQRAAQGAAQFERALQRANREQQRQNQLTEERIKKLEREASVAGKSAAVQRRSQFVAGFDQKLNDQQMARINAAFTTIEKTAKTGALDDYLSSVALKFGLVVMAATLAKAAIFDGIIGSTLYAARTEQLGVALDAVGKANVVSTATSRALEEQLKQTGITTQDSRKSLARLIAAHVDYTKAAGLARIAQNLGRVAGITSAEAFERLTHVIVTQQPEMLRTLGLSINLQREFEMFARKANRSAASLSEVEKRMITTNAVLDAGAAYNGVYADSMNAAGGKLLSMKRYALETADALGQSLLPELTAVVSTLEKMAKVAPDALTKQARSSRSLANLPEVLSKVVSGRTAVDLATGANTSQAGEKQFRQQVTTEAFSDKSPIRKLLSERLREATVGTQQFVAAQENIERQAIAVAELDRKNKEEAEKKAQAALERTQTILRNSQEAEMEGVLRIALQYKHLQQELGLTAEAKRNLARAQALDIAREEKQIAREVQKLDQERQQAGAQRRVGFMADAGREAIKVFQFEQATKDAEQANVEANYNLSLVRIEAEKEARIRALDAVRVYSVRDKVQLESDRAAVERNYQVALLRERTNAIDREASYRIEKLKETLSAEEQTSVEFLNRQAAIRVGAVLQARELELQTQSRLDEIRERAANRQRDIVIQRNEQVFDSLKRQSEGVIDALITRTNSLADAFKNIFKAALLTPLKDAFSNRVAAFLTGRVTGNPVTLQSQGSFGVGQGRLSGLGTLLDAIGVGRVPVSSQQGPGGTPPFMPQRQATSVGGIGLGSGFGITGFGGISSNPVGFAPGRLDGLRDFLGLGSSIGTGAGSATTFSAASFGQKLSSLGKSDAALMAGLGLGLAGWKRGGWSGAAMMGAGGAAIGFRFGGPIGAAVGAAVGFGAGAIKHLFFKGAEEKIVRKVQEVYGLKIDKQFAKMSLLPIIQQEFGGNIDVGVRSARVRELLDAYGQQTNQAGRITAIDNTPRELLLTQLAGKVTQAPTMVGGVGYNYGGATAGAGQRFAPNPNIYLNLQLDGRASTDVLRGETVSLMQEQPGIVAGAVRRSVENSAGGRQAAASFSDPLAVI